MVMRTEWRSYASFEHDERHLVRIETDLRIYCEFHGLLSEFVGACEQVCADMHTLFVNFFLSKKRNSTLYYSMMK